MALVPRYWYVEPYGLGEAFQLEPWSLVTPAPDGHVCLVDTDGEIYAEAVLMCALPWPRFRTFCTGEQVVLPFWAAETLERLESGPEPIDPKVMSGCNCEQPLASGSHIRVEVVEGKFFATFWCGRHFKVSFKQSPLL